jgi:hypothetical protein
MNDVAPGPAPAEDADQRLLEVSGQQWVVRAGGAGATGTGRWGLAPIEAIHFYRPGEARPRFEALLPRGRWQHLFASELAELLARATPVPPAE